MHGGIDQAVKVDCGYMEFEVVGAKNYLGERSHTRGANATSVDALMVGKKSTGSNILILIEWKYTEEYREENKYIPARYEIYNKQIVSLWSLTSCRLEQCERKRN